MRGYFGIGVEGLSKPMNAGNLYRSAHAFGASFVFTVAASSPFGEANKSDTSKAASQIPFYNFDSIASMRLPEACRLVGVEYLSDAVDLPSFRHPRRAAYVLGQERGALTPEMMECVDHVVRIPTKFALNLATAGAIVMYDRLISVQRFGARPVVPDGPIEALPEHLFGDPVGRRKQRRRQQAGGD